MSTIATINATDVIANSRTDINTNFSNLNTDKEEVSNKDTDNTLAANSDTKYPSQKAVKAYVLANVNPTGASWNEYAADAGATDAYVITLTGLVAYATGQTFKFKANTANTGAATLKVNSLAAITIKKDVSSDLATGDILANQIVTVIYDGTNMQMVSEVAGLAKTVDLPTENYTVGALDNALVKTYFNIQLPFILWTGSANDSGVTDFDNWLITSAATVYTAPMGIYASFLNSGTSASIYLLGGVRGVQFDSTNIVILDWWAKLPANGTGDINMGFTDNNPQQSYDSTNGASMTFTQRGSTGVLYAHCHKAGVGVTNTTIDLTGITITNWNNYRIELDLSNNALFYINGVLKATLSGTNFSTVATAINVGFGRSDVSLFQVTAPTLSLQMNP